MTGCYGAAGGGRELLQGKGDPAAFAGGKPPEAIWPWWGTARWKSPWAGEAGARTLGMATDEKARRGVSPVKRERLIRAGAEAIAGDFTELEALLDFLGL